MAQLYFKFGAMGSSKTVRSFSGLAVFFSRTGSRD